MAKLEMMTRDQQAARAAFEALLQHPEEADCRYDSFPESKGGRIISTDIARCLDERYRNPPAGEPKDLVPGWDCAYRYAQGRLRRELKQRSGREIVRFMAGGWGAGKTTVMERWESIGDADLAWDGTLSEFEWAVGTLDFALSQGWKVEIIYIFRDVEMALLGADLRAEKEGRGVPLGDLPGNHAKVQRSILRLVRHYRSHPDVSFLLIHNLGVDGRGGRPREVMYADLDSGGGLHYTEPYERYYCEAAEEIAGAAP